MPEKPEVKVDLTGREVREVRRRSAVRAHLVLRAHLPAEPWRPLLAKIG